MEQRCSGADRNAAILLLSRFSSVRDPAQFVAEESNQSEPVRFLFHVRTQRPYLLGSKRYVDPAICDLAHLVGWNHDVAIYETVTNDDAMKDVLLVRAEYLVYCTDPIAPGRIHRGILQDGSPGERSPFTRV